MCMARKYFTDEHDEIRRQLRRFVNEEIKPIGDQCERERIVPKSLFRKMGDLGFLGIGLPEQYGGTGEDIFGWMILGEEMGRCTYAGLGGVFTVHTVMAVPHLANAGNEAQLAKYMPDLISGETVCAIAISEEQAASDVGAMKTSARFENGEWVLNGSKFWISNGINADVYFVAARTDSNGKGANGISMFIVEKGTPGFRIGQKIEKMGFRASDTAELLFEDCRIPAENLLGPEGKGFYSVMKNFQNERLVLAAVNVGEAIAALSLTLDYVTQRKTFGLPLIDRQVIRQRLAMLHAKWRRAGSCSTTPPT
ncbi:MAG TPA: acyl-CoA dehydrogenase family protein [Sphingomicrobium sp.]